MKHWNVRKLTLIAILLAMALVLSIVESFIPLGIPGAKLGLANLVIMVTMYFFGFGTAFFVNLLRVTLASLVLGTFLSMGFAMSLAGAICSLLVMLLVSKVGKKIFTPVGVSIFGAYTHALAQIFVGVIYMGNWGVFYYFPFMAALSLLSGVIMGLLAELVLKNKYLQQQVRNVNLN